MKDKKPLVNLPPWVVDVRNSYKILSKTSSHAQRVLSIGLYESCGGEISHSRIFDMRQALLDCIEKCDKNFLPDAVPLDSGYHDQEKNVAIECQFNEGNINTVNIPLVRRRATLYFLPATTEKYFIYGSFEKYSELYHESSNFLGFLAIKNNPSMRFVGGLSSSGGLHGIGVRFQSVMPTTSREDFVEGECGEIMEALDENEIDIIIQKLKEKTTHPGNLKLLEELENKIRSIEQITNQRVIDEGKRFADEIKIRTKNLVSVLRDTGMVVFPKSIEMRDFDDDHHPHYFHFIPEENILLEVGRESAERKRPNFLKAKDVTDSVWILSGQAIAIKLIDLLPKAIVDSIN